MTDLKALLPDWYANVYEMKVLMAAEQTLLDDLAAAIEKGHQNQYVTTADLATIRIYETILNIVPKPDDDLALRRFRVLNLLAVQKPYTLTYLKEVLGSFGPLADVTMDYNRYRLEINSSFEKYGQIGEIESRVRQLVPANIVLAFENRLEGFTDTDVFLATGMVMTETVLITHDFKAALDVTGVAHVAGAAITANVSQITHDVNSVERVAVKPYMATGSVTAEWIEIE